MQVLFIGVSPSKELRRTLASHAIRVSLEKAASDSPPELVVVRIKEVLDIPNIKAIRRRFPDCWISLLVGTNDLKNTDLYSSLLACNDKNAVWHLDTWEPLFWFKLQEVDTARAFSRELKDIQHDVAESHRTTQNLVEKLEKDLAIAERIQEKLLHRTGPELPGIKIFSKYIAAPGLGGDYFDLFEIQEGRQLGILLVDSETHGMVAALLSVLLKLKVEDFKKQFHSPLEFLKHLEGELVSGSAGEIADLSLFFGILDRSTLTLDYVTAGILAPVLWLNGQQILTEDERGTLSLAPGDRLLLATQGLFHALGNSASLSKLWAEVKDAPMSRLRNHVLGRIDAYKDNHELTDDITFMGISVDPNTLVLKKNG